MVPVPEAGAILGESDPRTGNTILHEVASHFPESAVTEQQWLHNVPTWLALFDKILSFTDHVLNAQNKEGCTPLHLAILANQDYMSTALVRAGKIPC